MHEQYETKENLISNTIIIKIKLRDQVCESKLIITHILKYVLNNFFNIFSSIDQCYTIFFISDQTYAIYFKR